MTHNVQVLSKADYIVAMKDGKINEQGTYQQLIENEGHFSNFLLQYLIEETDKDEKGDTEESTDHGNAFERGTSMVDTDIWTTEDSILSRKGSIKSKSSKQR